MGIEKESGEVNRNYLLTCNHLWLEDFSSLAQGKALRGRPESSCELVFTQNFLEVLRKSLKRR